MNPETSILPTDKRFVFIGGLHRSGTSLVHEILKAHPEVSGFTNTGAPEDEGQHLQSVYAPSSAHGTFGTFGFDPDAHLTEESPLATPQSATLLWGQCAKSDSESISTNVVPGRAVSDDPASSDGCHPRNPQMGQAAEPDIALEPLVRLPRTDAARCQTPWKRPGRLLRSPS
ncbi:MAG: sulfotransferase [Actinobacteria bacterium]|nr:MAG: sulfotransferase [Actinomycetota bacterium]